MIMGTLDALIVRPPEPPRATQPVAPWRTFARIVVAISICMGLSALRGDTHPFWGVLVAVLILSYPGDQRTLEVRAVSRVVGTVVGIVIFLPLTDAHFGSAGYVAVLCVLLWFVARWTARNYLLGSVLITLLAMFMSVPLIPGETPLELTMYRLVDTAIAAVVAVAMLWILPPPRIAPDQHAETAR